MAKLPARKSDQHPKQSLCVRTDHTGQVFVSVGRRAETHGHICLCSSESNATQETDPR